MGENGLSASDVALMGRDGDGFGNGWGRNDLVIRYSRYDGRWIRMEQ